MLDLDKGPERSEVYLDEVLERKKRLALSAIPFEVSFLDDIAKGILADDFVIGTGPTGCGKSEMINTIAYNSAAQGKRVAVFALEAHRAEMEQRTLWKEVSRIITERGVDMRCYDYQAWVYDKTDKLDKVNIQARENVRANIKNMRTFYRKQQFTYRDITKQFEAVRSEVDLIVFDHLHVVDTMGDNENIEMKKIVNSISEAINCMGVPVIAAAHVRKAGQATKSIMVDTSDIHGASDISKVATKIFSISPLQYILPSPPGVSYTAVRMLKDRVGNRKNYGALMKFHEASRTYEQKYGVFRTDYASTKIEQMEQSELPIWARNNGMGLMGIEPNYENGKIQPMDKEYR